MIYIPVRNLLVSQIYFEPSNAENLVPGIHSTWYASSVLPTPVRPRPNLYIYSYIYISIFSSSFFFFFFSPPVHPFNRRCRNLHPVHLALELSCIRDEYMMTMTNISAIDT